MAVTTQNYLYTRLLKKAGEERMIPNRTRAAREWFRTKAQEYRGNRISQENLFKNSILTEKVLPGRMYMYVYDAKTKETLPYWDAFPVIFMVDMAPNGFYGLNLHYLPPPLRATLMDALYRNLNNTRFDDTTKLNLNYQTLKSASSMSLFKPCFKHYLTDHVKSRFIYIEPKEWDIAMFLPLQKFQKASAEEVWREAASESQPWQKWGGKFKNKGSR
jgi:hypothetical protein